MAFTFGKTPAPATGFSFGAPAPAPTSGFSFGGAPAPAVPPQASTFGGFGTTVAPAPAPTTSAFGGGTSAFGGGTSAFGGGTSTFGGSAPGFGGGTSAFGGATTGGFFGSTATPQQQLHNQQQLVAAAPATEDVGAASRRELEKLFVAYAEKIPSSNAPNPHCRMKHVAYNQVDPNVRYSYTRPAHIDEKAWKKAEEDNPDPGKLAPAAIIGWESLKERLVVQQGEMQAMAKNVEFMRSTAANGLRSVALVRTRMEASRRAHLAQAHRFLKIQRKLDSVRGMNRPLTGDDRVLRMRLERVHRSLALPQQTLKDLNAALLQRERGAEEVEEITDPEKLTKIFEALEGQRDGLEHLMRIVKKDWQNLEIAKKQQLALTQ
ncbi:unnamed protein product [Ascophyllum nodosum]